MEQAPCNKIGNCWASDVVGKKHKARTRAGKCGAGRAEERGACSNSCARSDIDEMLFSSQGT